ALSWIRAAVQVAGCVEGPLSLNATLSGRGARTSPLIGGYCCKSLFAQVTKNSPSRRRDVRVKMWTSSPDHKLTGDLGNGIEATKIGGRRTYRLSAGKLSPGNFRLLQQYRHRAAEALAIQCRELAEGADISPKWGNSRFDPNVWSGRALQEVFVDPG